MFRPIQISLGWILLLCVIFGLTPVVLFMLWAGSQPEENRFPSESSVRHNSPEPQVFMVSFVNSSCVGKFIVEVRDGSINIPDSVVRQLFPGCTEGVSPITYLKIAEGTKAIFTIEGKPVELIIRKDIITVSKGGGWVSVVLLEAQAF